MSPRGCYASQPPAFHLSRSSASFATCSRRLSSLSLRLQSRLKPASLVPVCSRAVYRTTGSLKALGKLLSFFRAVVHANGVASEKIAHLP